MSITVSRSVYANGVNKPPRRMLHGLLLSRRLVLWRSR